MARIPFIDAHVHANNRSSEDFERLRVVGGQAVVAVAGEEGGFRSPDSVLDHFRRLDRVDRPRVERAGLTCHLALGVHPGGIPARGVDELLAALPDALREHRAVAVGEIGLDAGGALEERVLAAQLEIAGRLGLRAVVHTPRRNKRPTLERILVLLSQRSLPPERVLLDHLNAEALPLCLDTGCFLGLSVHPAKLAPQAAAQLIADHPGRPFVLDTDLGSNPSHLFGIPATISALEELGVPAEGIAAAVSGNATRWLDLPGST